MKSAVCALAARAPWHSLRLVSEPDHNLAQSPLLAGASPRLLALLDDAFTPLNLARGQALFDQGDEDDRLYVLDQGLLEVSVLAAQGRKLSLNLLRPGDIFGEIALFDPGPRTARVEALEHCQLRSIRRPALMGAINAAPDLAFELVQIAGRRLRWMSLQLEQQVFLSQPTRLAARLLYLVGDSNEVRMSQAQLADYIGVTREAVSKTLSDWRNAGIVDLGRGRITLKDRVALRDLTNSDII